MLSTDGLTRIAHEVRAGSESIKGGIRRAAMVGASIERDRTMRILERMLHAEQLKSVRESIMAEGVREVVGAERARA